MFSLKPFATLPLEMLPQHIAELTTCNYIPTTKEELLTMDYFNLQMLMYNNIPFFNAAISLLDKEVAAMLDKMRTWDRKLKKVRTLDDVLNSKYYADTYEASRSQFLEFFLEHLWEL